MGFIWNDGFDFCFLREEKGILEFFCDVTAYKHLHRWAILPIFCQFLIRMNHSNAFASNQIFCFTENELINIFHLYIKLCNLDSLLL